MFFQTSSHLPISIHLSHWKSSVLERIMQAFSVQPKELCHNQAPLKYRYLLPFPIPLLLKLLLTSLQYVRHSEHQISYNLPLYQNTQFQIKTNNKSISLTSWHFQLTSRSVRQEYHHKKIQLPWKRKLLM